MRQPLQQKVIKVWTLFTVTPKSNAIFACYKFYNRIQEPNEPADQFVSDVKLLVKDSGHPSTIEDEIVRNRLVYGTNSQKVCE